MWCALRSTRRTPYPHRITNKWPHICQSEVGLRCECRFRVTSDWVLQERKQVSDILYVISALFSSWHAEFQNELYSVPCESHLRSQTGGGWLGADVGFKVPVPKFYIRFWPVREMRFHGPVKRTSLWSKDPCFSSFYKQGPKQFICWSLFV